MIGAQFADFVHHLVRDVDDVERVVFEVVDPGLVEPDTTRVNRCSMVEPDLWGGDSDPELLDEERAARTAEAELAAALATWEREPSAIADGTCDGVPVPPPHGGAGDDPVDDGGVSAGTPSTGSFGEAARPNALVAREDLLVGAPPPHTHVGLSQTEVRLILSE